jgi:NADPH:quinone reductase
MSEPTTPSDTMWAIGYEDASPVESEAAFVRREVPLPRLGPRDLLVEVHAVSVNPVDVKVRARSAPGRFKTLGFDAAGIVVEVGSDVALFEVGDHVYYAGALNRDGSNAQFQAVDERIVGQKPASLDYADAAALPLTTLTAYEALFEKLRLDATSKGTLLVIGAAGGVGSIMIQLAKALAPDVRVIATASRIDSSDWVTNMGADAVVDHRGDLARNVKDVAPEGVDWIFTAASSQPGAVTAYVEILKPFGQIVAIDDPHQLDVVPLKSKALTWHWELMFAKSTHHAADLISQHRTLNLVAELVDEGVIRSTATTRLSPIDPDQLREAHRIVESGRAIGKVVVHD